jgi:hypothetical protein
MKREFDAVNYECSEGLRGAFGCAEFTFDCADFHMFIISIIESSIAIL